MAVAVGRRNRGYEGVLRPSVRCPRPFVRAVTGGGLERILEGLGGRRHTAWICRRTPLPSTSGSNWPDPTSTTITAPPSPEGGASSSCQSTYDADTRSDSHPTGHAVHPLRRDHLGRANTPAAIPVARFTGTPPNPTPQQPRPPRVGAYSFSARRRRAVPRRQARPALCVSAGNSPPSAPPRRTLGPSCGPEASSSVTVRMRLGLLADTTTRSAEGPRRWCSV